MKKILLPSLIVLALVLVAQVLTAQPTALPPSGFAGPPVTALPIDGGLTLIIGGGIAYAAKKAYNKRKA
jgi:hypothetical protein